MPKHTLARALVAFIVLSSPLLSQEPLTTRSYDVSGLVRSIRSFKAPNLMLRPGGAGEQAVKAIWGEELEMKQRLSMSDLDDLMRGLFETTGADSPQIFVTPHDGFLGVKTSAAIHTKIEKLLGRLETEVHRDVVVTVTCLPAETLRAGEGAVLSPAEVEQALARAADVPACTRTIQTGARATLESLTQRAYLKDYDAEVAQVAKISDPLIDVRMIGLIADVYVTSDPRGGYVLEIQGQISADDGPLRVVKVLQDWVGKLQLPSCRTVSFASSVFLQDGGGIVLGSSTMANATWLVTARSALPPVAVSSDPDLTVVSFESLAQTRKKFPVFEPNLNPSGVGAGAGSTAVPDESPEPRPFTRESLSSELGIDDNPDDPGTDRVWFPRFSSHPIAIVTGTPAFRARIRQQIEDLAKRFVRPVTLELRLGTVEKPGVGPLLRGKLDPAELAGRLTTAANGTTIVGGGMNVRAGIVHAYLKDCDVEIAQEAVIGDPIVDLYFTGLAFSAVVDSLPSGRWHLNFDLAYQDVKEELETFVPDAKDVCQLELPCLSRVHCKGNMTVENHKWTILKVSPLEGTAKSLVVLVRATAAP